MSKLINAAETAEIISKKMNVPLHTLVDVFADIPSATSEEVIEYVCDNICKYPNRATEPEELEYNCERCFLNKIYDLEEKG